MMRGAAMIAALACVARAMGQTGDPPHEAVTRGSADRPIAAVVEAPDTDAAALVKMLTGTFATRAGGERPGLVLRSAVVVVESGMGVKEERHAERGGTQGGEGHDLLVEMARADAPADPFRVYVLRVYRRQGSLRVRALELPAGPGLRDALASLTAAPAWIPKIDAGVLSPSLDMPVEMSGPEADRAFKAHTERPAPVNIAGAIEMTARMLVSAGSVHMTDSGFDAEGRRVWGSPKDEMDVFLRDDGAPVVTREDDLVVVTTVAAAASATRLAPGGLAVFQYSSWLPNGRLLETSRGAGRPPASVHIPGSVLPGLNRALLAIAPGERRKIVIGPALGYGAAGNAQIPPNSPIIFDVECVRVDNEAAGTGGAPATPMRMFNPHAAPPGATPAPSPTGDGPIGTPPVNGGPETPR